MNGRLYRSRDDRMVAGVAGGLANYLNIDPSLVRILWVVLVPLTGGLILLLYLVMAIIVPEQRFDDDRWRAWEAQSGSWTPPPDRPPDAPIDAPDGARWASAAGFTAQPGSGVPAEQGGPMDPMEPMDPLGATPNDAAADAGLVGAPTAEAGADDATRAFAAAVPVAAATEPASPTAAPGPGSTWTPPPPDRRPTWASQHEHHHDRTAPLVFGLILVFIGAVLLARSYLPGIDWGLTWPILFVGIGIALLIGSVRRASR
jgi:phage shock protein C